MSKEKRFAVFFLLALAIFISAISFMTYSSSSASVTILRPSDVYFGFPAYGTEMQFSSQQSFNSIHLNSTTGYWNFDDYKFRVQTANMTINNLFTNDEFTFTVNASSGTSTTQIYIADRGIPYVTGDWSTWLYDDTTSTVTVTVDHQSEATVTFGWGASGGGIYPHLLTRQTLLTTFLTRTVKAGDPIEISGKLQDLLGNPLTARNLVVVDWNRDEHETKTDTKGEYALTLTAPDTAGTYFVKIVYASSSYFAGTTNRVAFTVLPTLTLPDLMPDFPDLTPEFPDLMPTFPDLTPELPINIKLPEIDVVTIAILGLALLVLLNKKIKRALKNIKFPQI